MAATLRINALKFVRRLTDAGMERPLAEAIVEGLSEADTSELATKADLRADLSELKADLTRLMMPQVVAIVGLGVALIKLLP